MINLDLSKVRWSVKHQKEINYDIIVDENIFDPQNKIMLIGGRKKNSRRFVVVDEFIYQLNYEKLKSYFDENHVKSKIVSFQSGEKNKTVENFIRLFKELDEFPIDRRGEPVIAIGGGVVTDIVGFVASCYRRGVPHVKIPTTLMGYVDAAVGIKTGVNFNEHKNRMGSFEPPKAVILNKLFLKTLPTRHILNGLGEIVKLAVIKDLTLFEYLEQDGAECIESKFQNQSGQEILDLSIAGMLEELQPNLYESSLERSVDFGHTFSPILEMQDVNNLLHGEAVAIDVAFSVVLANIHSLLSRSEQERVLDLIRKLGLPYYHQSLKPELLWESLIERTHHRDGLQRVPLPPAIGKCIFVNDIKYEEIVQACNVLENLYSQHG
uniref:sedoheptulose 7-phosphate cyclase n=1 Tax=Desulforadius tongensis TaxID=1216062 RepID=UPI00195BBDCB|nr:sedoheptulose 7-phosphate cyclase [Desulforadius tongensis]